MIQVCPLSLALPDVSQLPVILAIGFAVVFGTIGAKVFQRMRVPQVVGYIAIGLVLGQSGLKVISEQTVRQLLPFNYLALGIIGFMIGGELKR
jgi:Kef-type K+ transport system membrane component KefB